MADDKQKREDDQDGKAFDRVLFRKLLGFLKPYTGWVAVALLLLFAAKFLGNATPRVMQKAIDGPIARGDLGGLWYPVLIFLLLKSGAFISGFFQSILTTFVGQNIIRDLRLKIFSHILSLNMRFFSRNPVGKLMSRTVNDTWSTARNVPSWTPKSTVRFSTRSRSFIPFLPGRPCPGRPP